VYPDLLRKRELGQIDVCRIENKTLTIFEIKSSRSYVVIHNNQRRRLQKSGKFLSCLLNVSAKIKIITFDNFAK